MDFVRDPTLFLKASEDAKVTSLEIWKVDYDAVPLEADSFSFVGEAVDGSYFTTRNRAPLSRSNFGRLVHFLRSLQCYVNRAGALIAYIPPIDPAVSYRQFVRCLDLFDWSSFGIIPAPRSYYGSKILMTGADVDDILPPNVSTKSGGTNSQYGEVFDTTYDQIKSENSRLQATIDRLKADLASCESRATLVDTTSTSQLSFENSRLKAELEKVNADFAICESNAKLAETALEILKSENSQLLADWESRLKLAEATASELSSQKLLLQAELDRVKPDLKCCESRATLAEANASQLSSELCKVKAELKDARNTASSLRDEISGYLEKVRSLKDNASQDREEISSLSTKVRAWERDSIEIKSALVGLDNVYKRYIDHVKVVKQKADNTKVDMARGGIALYLVSKGNWPIPSSRVSPIMKFWRKVNRGEKRVSDYSRSFTDEVVNGRSRISSVIRRIGAVCSEFNVTYRAEPQETSNDSYSDSDGSSGSEYSE